MTCLNLKTTTIALVIAAVFTLAFVGLLTLLGSVK